MALGILIGSIIPDLDMLWFLFVDHGMVHHHTYWTHRPALWLLGLCGAWMATAPLIRGICCGALFHLVLDSIAGQINWGWPIWDFNVTLVTVPASQPHWIASFLLHWTFAVELGVLAAAIAVFFTKRRRP
ncbi:MAG: metal-dependent hydrolase [Paracoccaceae bacterium]